MAGCSEAGVLVSHPEGSAHRKMQSTQSLPSTVLSQGGEGGGKRSEIIIKKQRYYQF